MSSRAYAYVVLPFLMLLTGCGSGLKSFSPPDLTGNWQIGSTPVHTAGTFMPGVVLLGALKSSGSQVTGTFRFNNLAQPRCDFNEVVSVTGSIDSTDKLTLTSGKLSSGGVVHVSLLTVATIGNSSAGTIQVTGGSCPIASSLASGTEFPSVTGSFTGTLEPGTLTNPGTTGGGPATLALTQAANPNPDGQFAVTGSLNFTVGTCAYKTALTGTISGVGLRLSYGPLAGGSPASVFLLALESGDGSSLKVVPATFIPGPCSSITQPPMTFTGTLTRQ